MHNTGLKISIPPTILVGTSDENRFMWTDMQGKLKVFADYITLADMEQFIDKNM